MISEAVPSDGKENEDGEYEEYELESKARCLMEAEEIKQDSKLMEALKPYLDKKVKAIKSISQLRELAGKKVKE